MNRSDSRRSARPDSAKSSNRSMGRESGSGPASDAASSRAQSSMAGGLDPGGGGGSSLEEGLGGLLFSEKDLSNAAMIPAIMAKMIEQINANSRLVSGLTDIPAGWAQIQMRCEALEHEVLSLRSDAERYLPKSDFKEFKQTVAVSEQKATERHDAEKTQVEALIASLQKELSGHDTRILSVTAQSGECVERLDVAEGKLGEHREGLDEHAASLQRLEEELQGLDARLGETRVELKAQGEATERSLKSTSTKVKELGEKSAQASAKVEAIRVEVEHLEQGLRKELAAERKRTADDASSLEMRVATRFDGMKKDQHRLNTDTKAALEKQSVKLGEDIQKAYSGIMDKIMRTAEDTTDLGTRIGVKMESEARRINAAMEEISRSSENGLKELRGLTQLQMKQFEVEIRSSFDVFKASIKAIGPEMKEIAKRETFDLTQSQLSQHYTSIRKMMESKVDQVEASEILKRKADSISLEAFTRKADVDAMISDAVKGLQKQLHQKAKNATAVVDGVAGSQEAAEKVQRLEGECARLTECVDELYQAFKRGGVHSGAGGGSTPASIVHSQGHEPESGGASAAPFRDVSSASANMPRTAHPQLRDEGFGGSQSKLFASLPGSGPVLDTEALMQRIVRLDDTAQSIIKNTPTRPSSSGPPPKGSSGSHAAHRPSTASSVSAEFRQKSSRPLKSAQRPLDGMNMITGGRIPGSQHTPDAWGKAPTSPKGTRPEGTAGLPPQRKARIYLGARDGAHAEEQQMEGARVWFKQPAGVQVGGSDTSASVSKRGQQGPRWGAK